MKLLVRRAAGPLRVVVSICGLFGMLWMLTGCGVLGAMANPKVAWAVNDPAPMSVVVRRADAAEGTSKQVERLLTSTPASPDSDWLKAVGPKKEDAAGEMKALKDDPMYAQSHARVVPAEVWLRTLTDIQSTDGSSPNVLAIVSSDLGDMYAAIAAKEADIADLRQQIETEKAARDAKGVSDADKKEHDKNVDKLKEKVSKLEDDVEPLKKKFLAAAKGAAAKTPADARDAVADALVNLRQAVEDAGIANGAAAVKYPLAVTSMIDSVKAMVPVFIADIIEEQTGKRPVMQGIHPDVSLDGTKVKVSINGLSQDDLGKISLGDLTTETLSRTQKWVFHAVALLGTVSSTKEALSFEEDALDALLDGFASNGWKKIEPAKIPVAEDPAVASATAKVHPRKPVASTAVGVAETQPAKAKPGKSDKSDKAGSTRKPGDKPAADKPARPADKPTKASKPAKPAPAAPAPAAAPSPPSSSPAPARLEDFNP
ncbi:MAG TPA: hypothetical protein VIF15_08910 [Polyangiaceae bacterium]|jgi:hypothetical protein